ncbi:MAG: hypothetical protein ABIH42_08720 [Planctomycetota bacterium]
MENKELSVDVKSFDEPLRYGEIFAESKMFPDVTSAAQGAIKVMAGKEVGMSPIQSQNAFYFVSGRLGMTAQAMAALIKKSGKYDFEIKEHNNEGCTIIFYSVNGDRKELGTAIFNKSMAASAGIINKSNWKCYPMNMMFARALSNGARWFCPDAVSGFHTVEELKDIEPEKKVITIEGGEVKESVQ